MFRLVRVLVTVSLATFGPALARAQEPAPAPTPAASPTPPPPEPVAQTPAGGSLPFSGPAASKVFNPDIAVIGDFLGAAGKSPGGGEPSLEMHEVEVSFQAVVDPYARADFFLAASPEGVEIEEAYITFPTLPGGFLMKAGKLRAAFGKVNTLHNHTLPWTDRPLMTQNLVGGEEGLGDSGISLSRLFPNRHVFLEATGEVYRGQNEVFRGEDRGDLAYLGRLRAYRDLTESSNLDVGGSFAAGKSGEGPGLTRRLIGVDVTFRYRPLRRAIYRRLLARTELVWSRLEEQDHRHDSFGMYASAEYQFARRWFTGVRYDRSEEADEPRGFDQGYSLTLTYWPSEFSQIRSQFRRTAPAVGEARNEVLFQLLFSIGAHGAHVF
ncbi:MAG TPA: hypothetical protein VJU18_03280 [Vicinamibacteria bacterium]|nr:hypothetical protein [Vicinamibacteria bacterium]